MFNWIKEIINKRNTEDDMKAFKDKVYNDDKRNIIDDETINESQEIVDNFDKEKKELILNAKNQRKIDSEKIEMVSYHFKSNWVKIRR